MRDDQLVEVVRLEAGSRYVLDGDLRTPTDAEVGLYLVIWSYYWAVRWSMESLF